MEADWSVAAAADDPIIVVPWQDAAGDLQYIDLHSDPTLIDQISEARESPELREALLLLNQEGSPVWTAKCDRWELSDDEKQLDFEQFLSGFGTYIDIFRRNSAIFSSLFAQMSLAQSLTAAATVIVLPDARTEFVLRPAHCHGHDGYAMTLYIYGYGATTQAAQAQWAAALRHLVALLTSSRHESDEQLE